MHTIYGTPLRNHDDGPPILTRLEKLPYLIDDILLHRTHLAQSRRVCNVQCICFSSEYMVYK